MQLLLLHLDDALKSQLSFMESCKQGGAQQIDAQEQGAEIRLWGKREQFKPLQEKIAAHFSNVDEPQLCFMGSGDFHHVTALLLTATLEKEEEPITLIHFDNHPDWVNFSDGLHCGSWVNSAAKDPKILKIITIGVCSKDLKNPKWKGANLSLLENGKLKLFPYKPKKDSLNLSNITEIGEQEFIKIMLSRIVTTNIYITIDKDVLAHDDAYTNWDQGVMRMPFLLQLLREIGNKHKIIGADVTGDYSAPNYSGSFYTRLLKRAEIMIDQPFCKTDITKASALNSASNHALLEVLSEVMA